MIHDRLRRLCLLVAVASAMSFGTAAAWSYWQEAQAQRAVNIWYDLLREWSMECDERRTSMHCESVEDAKREFDDSVKARNAHGEDASLHLILAFAVPLIVLTVYFSVLWIWNGVPPWRALIHK